MKKVATILVLFASLTLTAVSAAHADGPQIAVVVQNYPSIEYEEFVGLFNSVLIEEIKKTDGQGFAAGNWGIFLFPAKRSRVRIIAIREGEGERPALVAVLKEDASFVSIRAVVERVIETVQRGGVK